MTIQLSHIELEETKQLLQDYNPAREAIAILEENDGLLEASFEELWKQKNGVQMLPEGKSLWEVTKQVLRNEICGDGGFRDKVNEYNKNKVKDNAAPLLTGLIVYLVSLIPASINPAIATIVVLYILRVGLDIFCQYTDSSSES